VSDLHEGAQQQPDHRQFLRNEFAMVEVTLLGERHAQRLRIRNAETDALNVLLRRRRGEFGLVEPDR